MTAVDFSPVQIYLSQQEQPSPYTEYKPVEALRRYICCYWVTPSIENTMIRVTNYNQKELVMPDGCIDVLFGFDQQCGDCRNLLVGTMSRSVIVDMELDRLKTFGIKFYPGGLQAFLKESSHKFTDKMEYLEQISAPLFLEFERGIVKLETIYEKINYANRYFSSRISEKIQYESEFQNVLHSIYQAKGNLRIKDITAKEIIEEKQLRRIFYQRVGVSPKSFMKIIRFQNVLTLMKQNRSMKLAEFAFEAGYYDEAHFIHDFRSFCGMNPTELILKMSEEGQA